MKRILLTTFFFFSCFYAQARHIPVSSSAPEPHIGHFCENGSNLHPKKTLYLVEVQQGYILFLAEKPCQSLYPLGYVDGMSLYNGYFAQGFDLDPMGTESIKKEISFTEYDSDYNPTKKINIEVFFDSKCKDKIDLILKIISKLQMKSFVAVLFADQRDDEKWFGKLTKEQKKTVQENFQKTYNATVFKKLEFNCSSCCKGKNGREPAARVASGVGKGHGSIDLCPPFFNLDTSQQLSSLFQEYTHIAFESHETGYKTVDPDVYRDPVYEGKTKKLKQKEKLINADTYSGAVNKIMSR